MGYRLNGGFVGDVDGEFFLNCFRIKGIIRNEDLWREFVDGGLRLNGCAWCMANDAVVFSLR